MSKKKEHDINNTFDRPTFPFPELIQTIADPI